MPFIGSLLKCEYMQSNSQRWYFHNAVTAKGSMSSMMSPLCCFKYPLSLLLSPFSVSLSLFLLYFSLTQKTHFTLCGKKNKWITCQSVDGGAINNLERQGIKPVLCCCRSCCLQGFFHLRVPESSTVGSAVGRIKAHDLDIGKNAEVEYNIVPGDGGAMFDITTNERNQEGIIILKKVGPAERVVTLTVPYQEYICTSLW